MNQNKRIGEHGEPAKFLAKPAWRSERPFIFKQNKWSK